MRLTSYQVTIAAPVEVVWAHLTTAEGLVRWVGPEATADPIPGGMLRWTHPNGATVVGQFLELIPYRRVLFTYGWEDGRLGVAPGSTTVEIDLVEEGGATTLRLVHHGLPPRPCPTTGRAGSTSSTSCATPCRRADPTPGQVARQTGRLRPVSSLLYGLHVRGSCH